MINAIFLLLALRIRTTAEKISSIINLGMNVYVSFLTLLTLRMVDKYVGHHVREINNLTLKTNHVSAQIKKGIFLETV